MSLSDMSGYEQGDMYREQLEAENVALRQQVEELTAALDRAQLSSIEGWNPGIDMDEVRRIREANR